MLGHSVDRHLTNKRHDHMLEEKRKQASLSGPRYIHPPDAVLRVFNSGNTGREVAVELEEIEMPPCIFLEVMGLARFPTLGAGVLGSSICADLQMEFSGAVLCVQALAHDFPGRRKPQTQGKYFFRKHDMPSCKEGYPNSSIPFNSTRNVEEP